MEISDDKDMMKTVKIARNPKLVMYGDSIIGTRDYQQDAYFISETENGSLAVICDGMGGMEHGELASRGVVEKLVNDFLQWNGEEVIAEWLVRKAVELDQMVANLQDEQGVLIDAGTTIVAVVVSGNELHWLSVGDSRIYIMRGEELVCVTRAHNYGYRLEQQLEKGDISQAEYESEKMQSEALISYLGMNGLELIDYNRIPFELESGDKVLLCSDGLYKCFSDEKLKEQLLCEQRRGIFNIIDSLIERVRELPRKNKDNTTVILLAYE